MKKQITLLLIIIIVFLAFYSVYYYSNYRVRHVPIVEHAATLDSTHISGSWHESNFSQNLLYSPGLPLAVNNFRDSFSISPEGLPSLDTLSTGNLPSFERPGRFLVEKSGRFDDTTLSSISRLENRHLNNDFEFNPPWQKGEWFIFSHYYYPVLFKNTFQLSPVPLEFKDKKVRALATIQNAKKQSGQFRVYQKTKAHFALEHTSKDNGKLVMALVPPQDNLKQTYEQTAHWVSENKGQSFEQGMGVLLPVMDFYLTKHITGSTQNSKASQATLNACQRISFSINAEYSFLTAQSSEPSLRFDRPFLIYHIPPEAKEPVFVMWVANPEILMPIDQPG